MNSESSTYVMGRNARETRRLGVQGRLYAGPTRHLLTLSGIEPGMRVLDVGCGAGDVTLEAARLVGPRGSVIGVDTDADVLTVAEQRVAAEQMHHVAFQQANVPEIPLAAPVDAIVGRLILIHLPNPVAAVRAMRELVRPGGIIAFQDLNTYRAHSVPAAIPLVTQSLAWVSEALRFGGLSVAAGDELFAILRDAGLHQPALAASTPASGDPDSLMLEHIAESAVTLLPLMERAGIATREDVGPDTLLARLRAELRETDGVVFSPELVSAWARV